MNTDMTGKVVAITGASSGIGQAAAEELAGMGARIVQLARSRERGDEAMARLQKRTPGTRHTIHYADLSRLSEMRRVAAEIAAAEPRIDVLINNAGAVFSKREVTEDGLERTFALNHMSYFVLTAGLRERLIASAPAHIVSVSSDAHQRARLDFNDLQMSKDFRGFQAYGRSKLCNILFTRELARRLADTQVTANCLHPGFVATRFGGQSGGLIPLGIGIAKRLFAISLAKGAETMVYLAASPEAEGVSGEYFYQCRAVEPAPAARDAAAARRLWDESERIAGSARGAAAKA